MSDITTPTITNKLRASQAVLNFTFSPQGAAVTFPIGVGTFSPVGTYYGSINTTTTFTATYTLPARFDPSAVSSGAAAGVIAQPIEFFWDFGDGVMGFGNPVTHTYKVASKHLRVLLRITDDQGRKFTVSKQMYLT